MKIVMAAAGLIGLALLPTGSAQAVGSRYPFCLQGDEFPGLSNCTYTSYQQCQASASGRFLTCIANPYFNPGGDPRAGAGYRRGPSARSVYPSDY